MSAANIINWIERGVVPDSVIRAGIRQLVKQRLQEVEVKNIEQCVRNKHLFIDQMNASPIALVPHLANDQHYEVPVDFYTHVLGPNRKYSSCYWSPGITDLGTAETDALEISCQRAKIQNGMKILELGCGWGSMTLHMAKNYPHSEIHAVSNSHTQRLHIQSEMKKQNIKNVQIYTADMNEFRADRCYDRIVSIEMFEHMRNYKELFSRISSWLSEDGRFFMHIFCHRSEVYEFVDHGPDDWMSRYFFSGGIMPSDDLPLYFQDDLKIVDHWRLNGQHYEKTANAWLANLDENKQRVLPVLESSYGQSEAQMWLTRWRVFFMACAELFGYKEGNEWWVSHYAFEKRA